MSRVCLLAFAALLTYARASEDTNNDADDENAAIADDRNATTAVTGELGKPLHVRCSESQDPTLYVAWYRGPGKATFLHTDSVYAMRRNALLIRSLAVETLGQYTCQAHNSEGVEEPRKIEVRAYIPDEEPTTKNKCLRPSVSVYQPRDMVASGPETTISTSTPTDALGLLGTDKLELPAFESGTAILRCPFNSTRLHSDPPPKITWKFGELKIDGNTSRYRLTSDGSLEIVSLYRNDTGVYICVADNGLRNVTQEIHLIVNETSITPERPVISEETTETSEDNTTSEGTTDVIGTITSDPRSGSQFGCCAGNETDGRGCPCNATEFGGCPNASELNNEGCPNSCSTSLHGCCQDSKTPAHGPEFEGCCLLQAFGCCPDNRKPAEAPHYEGCGCQYALHGCCPDNVTIAQGPDHQGCGCQYTQHGCCPDRHTAASGPNNEGCTCNTYQFGCCADGVTIAEGPEQQGCHCRQSTFGCCGDGETPAAGPDATGCDCSSSRHGCCPDGLTEATGPKFFGCIDAPENKQAACSMSTDPGPCHNFMAMWYYDLAYGGCSRFWYRGCYGNGNRFATKEECEDVCVQPSPKDLCKLPSVKGACDGDFQRWHYNSKREQCILFRYGGCLGNANNFATRELCQKQCESTSVGDQCSLPIDQGSCAGNYSRWGFNSEAHRCEQFIWGGCEGNSNRFGSKAACQMLCTGTQPPQCTQPQEVGNCSGKEALWSFSQSENRCLPFYYSGCEGNDNRFDSREACEQTCPSSYVPDKCTLPAETGQCFNYRERWFYDTIWKICRQFYYSGCGGNENNFATKVECDNSCFDINTNTTTTPTTTTTTPVELKQQTQRPDEPESRQPAQERSASPQALVPEVVATEGGTATLRCRFHSNSPIKITWSFGELTINGNAGRYRLTSDGALQIVSLHRNDTGVYICVANSDLGVVMQEIHLVVNDPVRMPVGIVGDENAVVTGELGQPLHVRCLAYGYPPPSVFWYRGYEVAMLPYNDAVYEQRGNVLLIRSLAIETLGQYTCQAYNGEGKAASWVVVVRAYMPDEFLIKNEFLVPRNTSAPRPRTQQPTTTTEVTRPIFTVPVSTHVSTHSSTLNIGADLRLTCEVDGFPEPDVQWTKDGANIQTGDGRITITGSTILSRLTVMRVSVADSGLYACHASNPYSSQSDTAQINVQQLVVTAKCTDNPFFADCDLIVRSNVCWHKYYSKYCCKSCVEAGQINPQEVELQADQPLKN